MSNIEWLPGLFEYLHEQLEQCPCTTTLHFTINFLRSCPDCEDSKVALKYLADHGGFCDCEIIMNVERKDDDFDIEDEEVEEVEEVEEENNIEDKGRDNGRIHRN